jgi:hypothetical protein
LSAQSPKHTDEIAQLQLLASAMSKAMPVGRISGTAQRVKAWQQVDLLKVGEIFQEPRK